MESLPGCGTEELGNRSGFREQLSSAVEPPSEVHTHVVRYEYSYSYGETARVQLKSEVGTRDSGVYTSFDGL